MPRQDHDERRSRHRRDATAGLVLGVESVPDGLAAGLLAGLNPVAGLYAYLYGLVAAAFVTSSTFMMVQGTGAMAAVLSDVDLAGRADPDRALVTLTMLIGIVMAGVGLLRGAALLRFVSMTVMVGFIGAVGVNIVLGQLGTFTGFESDRSGRISQAVDTVTHIGSFHWPTFTVGVITLVGIAVFERTRLGAFGLVIAVVAGSMVARLFDATDHPVQLVGSIADLPSSLPWVTAPSLGDAPSLIVPALSLAFVGLVQGAAIAATFPNPDGSIGEPGRNFVGQGVGNLTSGLFGGMPVGGSTSASSLVVAAGARTKAAPLVAGGVMALVILVFAGMVERIAMPSLAALLIVIGISTVKPSRIVSAVRTGAVEAVVVSTTFALTMIVPLQYAVVVGMGISVILHVVRQSEQLRMVRLETIDDRVRETHVPTRITPGDVIILQPHGSLFFAAAPTFESQLPMPPERRSPAVVILRLRGTDNLGVTTIEVLRRYSSALRDNGAKLVVVANDRVLHQVIVSGLADELGKENLYRGREWVGDSTRDAYADALAWVAAQRRQNDDSV